MLKIEDHPPELQACIRSMPEPLQKLVLSDMSLSDLLRAADVRLRVMVATYGPSRFLVNASDRLHEVYTWQASFDPKTDSMSPSPALVQQAGGIVVAGAEQAAAMGLATGKLANRKKR